MTLPEFHEWLLTAGKGDSITYYIGDLSRDRETLRPEAGPLADKIYKAYEGGFVVLTRQKLGENLYAYKATRSEEIVG